MADRLDTLVNKRVLLTRAPRFDEKAQIAPGCWFVVGMDPEPADKPLALVPAPERRWRLDLSASTVIGSGFGGLAGLIAPSEDGFNPELVIETATSA